MNTRRRRRFSLIEQACVGLLAMAMISSTPSAAAGSSSRPDSASAGATDPTSPDSSGASTVDADATVGGELDWISSGLGPTALDPKSVQGAPSGLTSGPYFIAVYDLLVFVAEDGTVTPRLAQSVTGDDDFTTWTIELRPDLQFTDGTPLDAEAVKANWDRHVVPENASQCILTASQIAETTVSGPTTLTVELVGPNSHFTFLLAGCLGLIASPTALETHGDAYGTTAETIVGAGPFTVESFTSGTGAVFVKNPTYWDAPRPYLDRINATSVISDPSLVSQTFLTEAAQLATFTVGTPAINQVEAAGFEPTGVEFFGGIGPVWNTNRPPLDDARVRRALLLAVDANIVNDQAFDGTLPLGETFFPESSPFYDPTLTYPTKDLTEAQRLIDEYLAEHGGSVDVSVMAWAGQTDAQVIALQQQIAELDGVNFTVEPVPPQAMGEALTTGDFEGLNYILNGVSPYPELFDFLHSDSPINAAGWSNPDVDRALDDILTTDDPEQIRQHYAVVVNALFEDAPYLLSAGTHVRHYAVDGVEGISLVGSGNIDLALLHLEQ